MRLRATNTETTLESKPHTLTRAAVSKAHSTQPTPQKGLKKHLLPDNLQGIRAWCRLWEVPQENKKGLTSLAFLPQNTVAFTYLKINVTLDLWLRITINPG